MKAVFLLQTDPYEPKPSLRALREAGTLAHRGWEVSFVSWMKGPAIYSGIAPFRVTRIHVPVPPLGTSFLGRARAYRRATRALANAAAAESPDLLIAHDFEVLGAAVKARRQTGAPLLYDSHEDWPAVIAENSSIESRLAEFQETRLCRRVAHVLTVSEPIANKFRAMKKPTTVLYNARPSEEVHLADRERNRARFGYDSNDFVVGFAGALGRGRGLEILLQAISGLPASVKALVVGGPEDEAAVLRQRAADLRIEGRVRIDGYRSFAELAPYYAAMDLGAILLEPWPNHLRALPNKIFDYMAHAVPVLVPDYPAMGALVRQTMSGWLLPSVDARVLEKALRDIPESSEVARRGKHGRQSFEEKLSWENQEPPFLRIVDSVVSARRLTR